jgi:hypothetical protein
MLKLRDLAHLKVQHRSWLPVTGRERQALHGFLGLLLLRLYRFQDLLNKARLRHRAYNFNPVVNHRFWHALHLVALSHVDELGDFDHIGGDVLVFDG